MRRFLPGGILVCLLLLGGLVSLSVAQQGQAPAGLLNEKRRGSISLKL